VTAGSLHVTAAGVEATLSAGDGFYVPAGSAHRYASGGREVARAMVGVAPDYRPGGSLATPADGLRR
jgi:mannose-6-phosphate isomerase-like protein (cupin superfamily)